MSSDNTIIRVITWCGSFFMMFYSKIVYRTHKCDKILLSLFVIFSLKEKYSMPICIKAWIHKLQIDFLINLRLSTLLSLCLSVGISQQGLNGFLLFLFSVSFCLGRKDKHNENHLQIY